MNRFRIALVLLVAASACTRAPEPRADTMAAMHAAHGAKSESAFAGVQSRGERVMGVTQSTSQHVTDE